MPSVTDYDSSKTVTPESLNRSMLQHRQKYSLKQSLKLWAVPFTKFHQVPVTRRIWISLAVMAIYSIAVRWIVAESFPSQVIKELGSAAYFSVILGLLLVFRTNSAYERWYEGRKLWGQLVNDSRNLSLKVKSFLTVPNEEKVRMGELIVSFAFALKHHLRDSRPTHAIPGMEGGVPMNNNIPVELAGQIYDLTAQWQARDLLDGFTKLQLDAHARGFMDILGACERIRSTPLAVSYRAFLRQGIVFNLLALPLYLPFNISLWLSLPLVLIGAYFMIGLELIAEDIEDPFGLDGDDLPLDQICSGIQRTVTEILGIPKQQFTSVVKLPKIDPLKPH